MQRSGLFLFISIFLLGYSQLVSAQTISTIAGTGTAGFTGDTHAATSAEINTPYGVAADAAGNIYFTDYNNNRIRRIDGTTGIITTIAGTGSTYFSGDGGPATAANIQTPRGITLDLYGNVIFSDYGNNRIRKINMTTGIITTLTGGATGFSGDGGPATAASTNYPWAVATDEAGNVYFSDYLNCRIRKINSAGIISTIAGTGICFYSGDGGPATAAKVQYPTGLAVDGGGNIYIADNGNNRVRKINSSGIISTLAGSPTYGFTGDGGPSTAARLRLPTGLALDDAGNLYITDADNNRIRKINTSGIITTIAGNGTGAGSGSGAYSGDGGPATAAELNEPSGIAVITGLGKVIFSDNMNNRVRVIDYFHAPVFDGGHVQSLTVCENSGPNDISSLLNVDDISIGVTETWSVVSLAHHGTAFASYGITSTGSTLYPTGLTYTPTAGYSGADTFSVMVNNGTYADTTVIYVTILPLVNAGVITGLDSVCPGHIDTLSDSVSGGTWVSQTTSVATVSPSGVVTGVMPGNDTITYTVMNACDTSVAKFPLIVSSYAICHTGVTICTGVAQQGIIVSSNPNRGAFSVTVATALNEETHLTISNIEGKKLKEYTFGSNQQFPINSGLPAGTYFLNAYNSHDNFASKMVITQ